MFEATAIPGEFALVEQTVMLTRASCAPHQPGWLGVMPVEQWRSGVSPPVLDTVHYALKLRCSADPFGGSQKLGFDFGVYAPWDPAAPESLHCELLDYPPLYELLDEVECPVFYPLCLPITLMNGGVIRFE